MVPASPFGFDGVRVIANVCWTYNIHERKISVIGRGQQRPFISPGGRALSNDKRF